MRIYVCVIYFPPFFAYSCVQVWWVCYSKLLLAGSSCVEFSFSVPPGLIGRGSPLNFQAADEPLDRWGGCLLTTGSQDGGLVG